MDNFILIFSASCTLISQTRSGRALPPEAMKNFKTTSPFFYVCTVSPFKRFGVGQCRCCGPTGGDVLSLTRPQNVVSCQNPERRWWAGPAATHETKPRCREHSPRIHSRLVSLLSPLPLPSSFFAVCLFCFLNAVWTASFLDVVLPPG